MMIGVVLWKDREDRQAVIWCEDQGELAYLSQPALTPEILEIGDVVQVDLDVGSQVRRASSAKRLLSAGGLEVLEALSREVAGGENVVPFRAAASA
ncbi:MAG: hypothetical protein AAGF60_14535 [Pseudomonadota bacterium]